MAVATEYLAHPRSPSAVNRREKTNKAPRSATSRPQPDPNAADPRLRRLATDPIDAADPTSATRIARKSLARRILDSAMKSPCSMS
jgi:hypothetical protein